MHSTDYTTYSLQPSVETDALRQALRQWASGVTVVTAGYDGQMYGITASSFTSITFDPPVIMVAVNNSSSLTGAILGSQGFAVHILHQAQQELSATFASPVPGEEKFKDLSVQNGQSGAPILEGALAVLDCALYQTLALGTHTLFFGRVLSAQSNPQADAPLVYYHRGYRNISGSQ